MKELRFVWAPLRIPLVLIWNSHYLSYHKCAKPDLDYSPYRNS